MLFHNLHEGFVSLAYVYFGACKVRDVVDHATYLFRRYGVFAEGVGWSMKLVLTKSRARIGLMASNCNYCPTSSPARNYILYYTPHH